MSEDAAGIADIPPSASTPQVRFFHAGGHTNVRRELEALLRDATNSLRAAVCFFTAPGFVLLRKHGPGLSRPGSFFVASVDFPTNLDALNDLHSLAPGNVYIHLGGSTPEEKKVGRALMHSKVLLAIADSGCRLWVGSHNLTGQAIEGGNLEAGVQIDADLSYVPIQDAMAHLEVCRATAEGFDPLQMERYKDIQRQKMDRPAWIIPSRLLVIHAEAVDSPANTPFTVHLRIVPTDYDPYFVPDREVRLYLYPPGVLAPGRTADVSRATLWKGTLTAVVRTDIHPMNGGIEGLFSNADFELDMPDLRNPPRLLANGRSTVTPTSQIVLRMDDRGRAGEEAYSIDSSVVDHYLDSGGSRFELHEVDEDMRRFFTPASFAGNALVYRPVNNVKQRIKVAGYEETMRTDAEADQMDYSGQLPSLVYEAREKEREADAFLFVTKYLIRRTEQ